MRTVTLNPQLGKSLHVKLKKSVSSKSAQIHIHGSFFVGMSQADPTSRPFVLTFCVHTMTMLVFTAGKSPSLASVIWFSLLFQFRWCDLIFIAASISLVMFQQRAVSASLDSVLLFYFTNFIPHPSFVCANIQQIHVSASSTLYLSAFKLPDHFFQSSCW